jgi:heptosyltransferase II
MNRILVIAPNWIGDAVMSQPLLAAIKASYPHAVIDVLATPWVAPVYRACSEVTELIEADLRHGQLQWGLRRALAARIKQRDYAACYVLPNSLKSALIPWLAGIPIRIGYQGELRRFLLTETKANSPKTQRIPMVEHYTHLCAPPGNADATIREPQLSPSASALEAARTRLEAAGIQANTLVVLCPGAEYGPSKRWPAGHFAELAQSILKAKPTAAIVLIGSPSDRVIGDAIVSGTVSATSPASRIFNWCGSTSLDEAISIIRLCSKVVSNDSGLMHIAAALHIPQVAVFGSSDPNHTPPNSAKAIIISLHLPCSPCHQRECPLGHLNCLNQISPERVFAALQ